MTVTSTRIVEKKMVEFRDPYAVADEVDHAAGGIFNQMAGEDIPQPSAKPLEYRAGVDSLEELHIQRREIIKRLAPLELLFGSGGDRWDATRKRHRNGVMKLIRNERFEKWQAMKQGSWKEPAQNELETAANSDDRHINFVVETEAKFAEWMDIKNELDEVNEKISSRDVELRAYTGELFLQRG